MSNYFNILYPESWYCNIEQFEGILIVNASQISIPVSYQIWFSTPIYFRCPMMWKGVNFKEASNEEWNEFALSMKDIISPTVLREYRLFLARVDNDLPNPNLIQIVAIKANIREKK